jgi:zinc-ribbon domain
VTDALTCPRCATEHPPDERFCRECGMPLVHAQAGEEADLALTPAQERARKINPMFAEGDLVRVAGGRNQAEAEFIQGLLLEEGVPSTTRRSRGFDVPDFLAAGPRDVLVPISGADAARDVLLQARMLDPAAATAGPAPSPTRLLAGILGGLALIAIVLWLGSEIIG